MSDEARDVGTDEQERIRAILWGLPMLQFRLSRLR